LVAYMAFSYLFDNEEVGKKWKENSKNKPTISFFLYIFAKRKC